VWSLEDEFYDAARTGWPAALDAYEQVRDYLRQCTEGMVERDNFLRAEYADMIKTLTEAATEGYRARGASNEILGAEVKRLSDELDRAWRRRR
jgi:hypothetical protein